MLIALSIRQQDGIAPYGMVLIRQASPVLVGSYVAGVVGGSGALLGLESTCTGSLLLNNTLHLKSGSTKVALNVSVNNAAGSSGIARNNLIIDDSTDPSPSHTFNCFNAANFAAWTLDTNFYRAVSPRWSDGTTVHTTFANWNATAANDAGWSATDPVVINGYELPTGSPLIGAGVKQTPIYIGLSGVMFPHGGPTLGCSEALNN